jgi:hypothetical protein
LLTSNAVDYAKRQLNKIINLIQSNDVAVRLNKPPNCNRSTASGSIASWRKRNADSHISTYSRRDQVRR